MQEETEAQEVTDLKSQGRKCPVETGLRGSGPQCGLVAAMLRYWLQGVCPALAHRSKEEPVFHTNTQKPSSLELQASDKKLRANRSPSLQRSKAS